MAVINTNNTLQAFCAWKSLSALISLMSKLSLCLSPFSSWKMETGKLVNNLQEDSIGNLVSPLGCWVPYALRTYLIDASLVSFCASKCQTRPQPILKRRWSGREIPLLLSALIIILSLISRTFRHVGYVPSTYYLPFFCYLVFSGLYAILHWRLLRLLCKEFHLRKVLFNPIQHYTAHYESPAKTFSL